MMKDFIRVDTWDEDNMIGIEFLIVFSSDGDRYLLKECTSRYYLLVPRKDFSKFLF